MTKQRDYTLLPEEKTGSRKASQGKRAWAGLEEGWESTRPIGRRRQENSGIWEALPASVSVMHLGRSPLEE